MIVWGGWSGGDEWTADPVVGVQSGGRYNPASDTWSATTTEGAPFGGSALVHMYHDTAVWTGDKMIVFGSGTYSYTPPLKMFLYLKP
jgi:hypothetical protein